MKRLYKVLGSKTAWLCVIAIGAAIAVSILALTGCDNGTTSNGGSHSGENTSGDNTGNNNGGNTTGDNTGGNNGGNNTGDNTGGNTGGNNTGSSPNAPSTVYATSTSSSSITVSWSYVSDATGYYVYRRVGTSGSYNYRGSSTSTTYSDTGLSSNTTYYYKVSAYNSNGESSLSAAYDYATTTSGIVAGSSYSNAITIPSSGISGSFPSGLDAVWYKFTGSASGMLGASDREYSSTYTSDIVVDVYDSDLYLISAQVRVDGSSAGNKALSGIDVGDSITIYATNWSGTYYVKVQPYNGSSSNKGTFYLLFVD